MLHLPLLLSLVNTFYRLTSEREKGSERENSCSYHLQVRTLNTRQKFLLKKCMDKLPSPLIQFVNSRSDEKILKPDTFYHIKLRVGT